MFHESMENQFSWNLMLRYMKYSERKISQCIPFFKHFSNKDLKTLYQQLIQIFQIYLKVTIHIWRPWKLSSFQEDSACSSYKIRPKFFHPLDLGHPIPNKAPSQNDNQSIKKKYNPRMTIICYQVIPSGQLSFSVSTH